MRSIDKGRQNIIQPARNSAWYEISLVGFRSTLRFVWVYTQRGALSDRIQFWRRIKATTNVRILGHGKRGACMQRDTSDKFCKSSQYYGILTSFIKESFEIVDIELRCLFFLDEELTESTVILFEHPIIKY